MPSSQIVTHVSGKATIPKSNPPKTFLLPFGKNLYLVPESAFVSYPKKPNVMPSGDALGALLATKAPEKWLPYCHPDTLCRIKGDTGNCVYTTFSVDGQPDEKRILRFISATVAEKNFFKVKEEIEGVEIQNERQQIRVDVLNWTKDIDCPGRAQISPEIEKWDTATGPECVKSCAKSPESKKRSKPGSNQVDEIETARKKYIVSENFVKVPEGSSHKINQVGGLIHIVFYRSTGDDDDDI